MTRKTTKAAEVPAREHPNNALRQQVGEGDRSERAVAALEALAAATDRAAQAVATLSKVLQGGGPPPKAPAAVAERPVPPTAPEARGSEKTGVTAKEDVRRAMVAVAKARGGDFLAAYLKSQFGVESIAGLRAEQYGAAVAALESLLAARGAR